MTLSYEQYNVLNKIARRTKMDCWFHIQQIDGVDYIYDLEDERIYNLQVGLNYLVEGLDCVENISNCYLSSTEKAVFCELCQILNVIIPIALEVR